MLNVIRSGLRSHVSRSHVRSEEERVGPAYNEPGSTG